MEWVPEQRFALAVLAPPTAMDEISPYREIQDEAGNQAVLADRYGLPIQPEAGEVFA